MNCKPGDLAIIVPAPGDLPGDVALYGKIVRVTSLDLRLRVPWPCWHYEGPRLIVTIGCHITSLADRCLRPLPPPDATENAEHPIEETA